MFQKLWCHMLMFQIEDKSGSIVLNFCRGFTVFYSLVLQWHLVGLHCSRPSLNWITLILLQAVAIVDTWLEYNL